MTSFKSYSRSALIWNINSFGITWALFLVKRMKMKKWININTIFASFWTKSSAPCIRSACLL